MKFAIVRSALGAVFLWLAPANAEPEICVETESLAEAYQLVLAPWPQTRLSGGSAADWLDIFNNLPPTTDFRADKIIFQGMGNGGVVALLSSDGVVCERFSVPAQTHLRILNELARRQS